MANGGLAKLANDLDNNANRITGRVRNVVVRHGNNVKRMWALNAVATARQHGKHYPRSISVDVNSRGAGWINAEIGPDKGKTQGPLGNLLEFGSRNNPAHKDGERALAFETPRFFRGMERAAELKL